MEKQEKSLTARFWISQPQALKTLPVAFSWKKKFNVKKNQTGGGGSKGAEMSADRYVGLPRSALQLGFFFFSPSF